MVSAKISIGGFGEWDVFSPPTVYPPREDSIMLCNAVSEFSVVPDGKALEIGCGSGIVTMVLSSLGWEVTACDLNPFAVSATRGNMEKNGIAGSHRVIESGIGEELKIPEGTRIVVWNLPYLDSENDDNGLSEIEKMAWSDRTGGGWGGELLNYLEDQEDPNRLIAILVMKTEPESDSKVEDWERKGWTSRSLSSKRFGDEKIEIVAFWKTGSGNSPSVIEECASTMDEAREIQNGEWTRLLSKRQTDGRGRKKSEWISEEGGVFATWILDSDILKDFSPGIIQTSIGSVVSKALGAEMKWPNDIVNGNGEKMGGVLVETSNDEFNDIRVGVGVNRFGFDRKNVIGCGWEETIGDVDSEEVFHRIDRGISSIFEKTGVLPRPTKESLAISSWISLSKSLSRGLVVRLDGDFARPSGLNGLGELRVTGKEIGSVDVVDLDLIEWFRLRV